MTFPLRCLRRRLLRLTAASGLLLTGCAGPSGPSGPAGTVPPLPDDLRVFMPNRPLGYFSSAVDRAVAAPLLVIYGDGRVVWSEQPRRDAARIGYRRHRLDPQTVARFAAEAAATAVISEDVDFATPP